MGINEKNLDLHSSDTHTTESGSQTPPLPTVPVVQQLYSMQFWDDNPEASKARWMYIKILVQRTLLAVVAIFCIFSIYWGAVWQLPARSLRGWIIVSVPVDNRN